MLECFVHLKDVDDDDEVALIEQIETNERHLSEEEVEMCIPEGVNPFNNIST